MRVEDAVDKFLYWDEEVTLIEAVNAETVSGCGFVYDTIVSSSHKALPHSLTISPPFQTAVPDQSTKASTPTDDTVYDDSGVSSSSEQSAGHVTSHVTSHVTTDETSSNEDPSSSEKWALASKYCADAKDYLEMMCRDLSSELNQFDLQKELELKQILMEYAARQLERHEKVSTHFHTTTLAVVLSRKWVIKLPLPPPTVSGEVVCNEVLTGLSYCS